MAFVRSVISGNLASVSVGLCIGWISLCLPKLKTKNSFVALTDNDIFWCTSSVLVGTAIGLIISLLCHVLGRKTTLIISALPSVLGWFPIAFANSVIELCIGNVLIAMGIGITVAVTPIYFCEISPINRRGAVGCSQALFQQIGVILAFILDTCLPMRHQALICSIVPLIFSALFIWAEKSPYYLALRGQYYKAEQILVKLRATSDVDDELKMIMNAVQTDSANNVGFDSSLFNASNHMPLFTLIILIFAINFSGYQIMVSFAKNFFSMDTTALKESYLGIILAVLNISVITGVIYTVDFIGRKPLLLVSTMGSAICTFIVALSLCVQEYGYHGRLLKWLVTVAIIGYFVIYAIGLMPISKFLVGEYFLTRTKLQASVVLGLFDALCSFSIAIVFHMRSNLYGSQVSYFVFTAISLIVFANILYFMHETKGKSLGQIQSLLMKKKCTVAICENIGKIESSSVKCN